jgi:hypothetical protein
MIELMPDFENFVSGKMHTQASIMFWEYTHQNVPYAVAVTLAHLQFNEHLTGSYIS